MGAFDDYSLAKKLVQSTVIGSGVTPFYKNNVVPLSPQLVLSSPAVPVEASPVKDEYEIPIEQEKLTSSYVYNSLDENNDLCPRCMAPRYGFSGVHGWCARCNGEAWYWWEQHYR